MQLTRGEGVNMVFETAGSRATTQQTIELVKRGGQLCWWVWLLRVLFPAI